MNPPLLSVQDLSIRFGQLQVVDQLSFSLQRGEALGLVGESGCGKSVTSLALMGLLQGAQVEGSIRLDDRPLLGLSQRTWQEIRGRRISMVFQDPMTTLNPLMTVGAHLAEALQTLQGLPRSACRTRAAEWLELVGIPDPVRRLEAHPHELSGGMRQRVSIALALCGEPSLLLADEPTTALDVTIQAQVLDLLDELRRKLSMAMVFVTHDLGVVERMTERLAVLYAGRLAECGPTSEILSRPRHPYTAGLLGSRGTFRPRGGRSNSIPGQVPSPREWPSGCRFHPRCPHASDLCRARTPAPEDPGAACHHPLESRP